jgi:hypothetical protein
MDLGPTTSASTQLRLQVCPDCNYLLRWALTNFFFFFLVWYWSLNSGPSPWALHQPYFCEGFFKISLMNNLPMLASKLNPPDLCLLNS